jgi:hypothetical protein
VSMSPLLRRAAGAVLFATTVASLPVALEAQAARRTVTRVASGTVDTAAAVTRGSDTLPTLNIDREVFSYRGGNRRDPYESLMRSDELRPLVSDLRLTAVAFDPNGKGSVAILRDVVSQNQYRVRVGQTLGRLRVSGIRQKAVIFSIDEFGFSRQETLPLTSDSTTTRTR